MNIHIEIEANKNLLIPFGFFFACFDDDTFDQWLSPCVAFPSCITNDTSSPFDFLVDPRDRMDLFDFTEQDVARESLVCVE